MPELPEVETIRRQIAPVMEGRRVVEAWVDLPRIVRPSPEAFVSGLRGRRIQRACRRGKQMYFPLDSGQVLTIHLGMTGRLEAERITPEPPARPHVHGVLTLDDGWRVVFSDPRTFGELGISADLAFLDRYGPEPLDDDFDPDLMVTRLKARRTAIKSALLDQRLVAGIGNIYADEICFLAGIAPMRAAASLSRQRLRRVVDHMRPVLERAIQTQGATARPTGRYYDIFGQSGEYLPYVYGREGEPCSTCQTPIRRGVLGTGKSARACHWCPRCQR